MTVKKIVFCTLRNNKGATGGPGGVLYMLSQLLGKEINGIESVYRFNPIKYSGKFHGRINRLLFRLRCLLDRNVLYISHDIVSASILAEMHKPYSLVYHNQGPIIFEKIIFGKRMSEKSLEKWKTIERMAFTNAQSLHFPSNGACDLYFQNPYSSCLLSEVRLGAPLYNTIQQDGYKVVDEIGENRDYLTFFSLGSLTKSKGQDMSISFIEAYLKEYPNMKVRYIIVGNGPLQHQVCSKGKELMDRYQKFKFIYYPSLPHDEVMYIHRVSDVYIMLHRLSIFDFATLEAMSARTAVILSPIGGNLDFNKNRNIIYSSDNYSDAVHQITVDKLRSLKDLNYRVFHDFFSEAAFINGYRKMLHNQLNEING